MWKELGLRRTNLIFNRLKHFERGRHSIMNCPQAYRYRVWITDPVLVMDEKSIQQTQTIFMDMKTKWLHEQQSSSSSSSVLETPEISISHDPTSHIVNNSVKKTKIMDDNRLPMDFLKKFTLPFIPLRISQELYDSMRNHIDRDTIDANHDQDIDDENDITHYDYYMNGRQQDNLQWFGRHFSDSGLTSIVDEVVPEKPIDWIEFCILTQQYDEFTSLSKQNDYRCLYPQFSFIGKTGSGDQSVDVYGKRHCDHCNLVTHLLIRT